MSYKHALVRTAWLALIASSGAAYAAPEIQPAGTGDDTARLQAALSGCTNQQKACDIRLGAGIFYTDVLLAKGFNGAITGRGQGRTVIRPLAHRPLRSTPLPFIDEPTLAQPYPVLLHFANNSRITISGLTLEFPSSMTVMPYEVPYPGNGGVVLTDTLVAAILVDGERHTELKISNVTIIGADNDSYDGSNVSSGVRFEGPIRYSGGVDQTRKMQRGRIYAFNNRMQRTGYGIQALFANQVEGLFNGNKMDVRIYGISIRDLGASKVTAVRNDIDAELSGFLIGESPEQAPATPSDYDIAWNRIRVNETGLAVDPTGGYAGIGVVQFSTLAEVPVPETFISDVTLFANDITIPEHPVQAGVFVAGDGKSDVRIIGNRIRGAPYDTGIFVDASRGTLIAANDLRGVDPPNEDVHLTASTRQCKVVEPGDTVLDEGTGNQGTH